MRSVVVVLPASMWAMTPMFRTRSSGILRAMARQFSFLESRPDPAPEARSRRPRCVDSPAVVRERLVRLGHPMGVLALLDRGTLALGCVHQLVGKLLRHRLARTRAGRADQPAHRQRDPTLAPDLDRDLVGRAADAPWLDLQHRRGVAHGGVEHVDRIAPHARLDQPHRRVDDSLRGRLLAAQHHLVDELRERAAVVARIGQDDPALDLGTTWHLSATPYFPAALGALAPYFERPFLRFETPAASRVPRIDRKSVV